MVRVAFSPDGSVVAVVSWSGDIDLLRSEDLSLIRSLKSRTGSVQDAGLPNGFPVIAISSDNNYSRRLDTDWTLRTDDLIDTACRIVDRDLTEQEWAQYVGEGVPYRQTCSSV